MKVFNITITIRRVCPHCNSGGRRITSADPWHMFRRIYWCARCRKEFRGFTLLPLSYRWLRMNFNVRLAWL
jgi:transposase-like protein